MKIENEAQAVSEARLLINGELRRDRADALAQWILSEYEKRQRALVQRHDHVGARVARHQLHQPHTDVHPEKR